MPRRVRIEIFRPEKIRISVIIPPRLGGHGFAMILKSHGYIPVRLYHNGRAAFNAFRRSRAKGLKKDKILLKKEYKSQSFRCIMKHIAGDASFIA